MADFTKGKWQCCDGYIFTSSGDDIALVVNAYGDNTEAEANARLISAAPEMYELLYSLVHEEKDFHTVMEIAKDLLEHINRRERKQS